MAGRVISWADIVMVLLYKIGAKNIVPRLPIFVQLFQSSISVCRIFIRIHESTVSNPCRIRLILIQVYSFKLMDVRLILIQVYSSELMIFTLNFNHPINRYYNRIRTYFIGSLQWHHNERDGVSDHQPRDCVLNPLFRCRSKKISKLRVTDLCQWPVNSPHKGPVTRKMFPFDDVIRWITCFSHGNPYDQ